MQAISTGIKGLDFILNGGFAKGATVIVEGQPGTGKTTLGMQFLYHGAKYQGESGIYITFEELPEQIYADMLQFGWDIKQLEAEGKLRVLCISPDVLMEQMIEPNGLFEQIIRQMNCKRIVIDSISLFKYVVAFAQSIRPTIYRLRNILRKFSLTALLIREQTEEEGAFPPFENYVFDGVIRLKLKPYMETYRIRTLEVLKMRGRQITEGEHAYRITNEGIYLLPARSMVGDYAYVQRNEYTPTGIDKLDEMLGGGIAAGTIYLLDTNSKANYKYIVAAILASRLNIGENLVAMISSLNTAFTFNELMRMFDINAEEVIARKGLYFIEHYNRSYPDMYLPFVLDASKLTIENYKEWLVEQLGQLIRQRENKAENWFLYYDLNTIIAEHGKDYVKKYFAEETALARTRGITVIVLCNFAEIGEEMASYLQRTVNGVIRTWVDGSYQYLQVTKSANGKISEPMLVENISQKPFIRLL
ncbi:circadian clock protein KaiC [Paenibacillus psychroresistens]|uniref:Circadian clock protein KaiC n=1 Tax=Paenibacillus psychroresistens TaxID=1778678 RepID=A0A6B8RZW7_9BACL|nr:ATPase domain-containing protein [Paenibacillus psychroresistens]QGR00289.1 circadian clock protein KaiC [Paenibacillus psychroresistens]